MISRATVVVAIVCSMFLLVQPVWAQASCKALHVIVQARAYGVPAPDPYKPGWSGPFAGTLDGVPVAGLLSYAQPPEVDFPPPGMTDKGKAGKETNVVFKFEFTYPDALAGTFQSVKDFGVFPVNQGQGLGNYSSTGSIDAATGTGAFQSASGFFTIAGPAIAPILPPPAILSGAVGLWSPEVNGKICFGK